MGGTTGQVVPREETPPGVAAVFNDAGKELEKLGFCFHHAAVLLSVTDKNFKVPLWVYSHPETLSYAFVTREFISTGSFIPKCSFVSFFEDGRELETSVNVTLKDATPVQLINPVQESSLEAQHQSHLECARKIGKPKGLMQPEELYLALNQIWRESMKERLRLGEVIRLEDGSFVYTVREALLRTISLVGKIKKTNRSKVNRERASKLSTSQRAATGPEEEIEQYRKFVKDSETAANGTWTKLVLLLISLLLLCLAFRLSFSWKTVLILLGVLTFHEGGHLLGMRIFGYKNLQLLFLPFLGAVAIGGKREYVAPWKELVVLFLGPLPGFFAGIAVLTIPLLQKNPALHELGLMLVGLNLFNLIPVHPLDGGQIWDILLFRRTPIARAIFLGLGALLLFLAGFVGVFGKAFLVFGGVLLWQFPAQLRQAKLVGSLRKQYGGSLSQQNEETILASIFQFLRSQSAQLPLGKKIVFTKGILAQTTSDPAGPGTFLFGLGAYFSPIWVPILGVLIINLHVRMVADSELSKARTSGLLAMPMEKIAEGEIDAGPALIRLGELLKQSDIDLKLLALERHVAKPGISPEQLRQEINQPDLIAFLALARQFANADFINSKAEAITNVSLSRITHWLVLASECAALTNDEQNAWANLEAALHSVRVKSVGVRSFGVSDADAALSAALRGMERVLMRLSPGTQEIARLRDLISPRHLGHPILHEKLQYRIRAIAYESSNNIRLQSVSLFLLNCMAPYSRRNSLEDLADIKELKGRLNLADSDPEPSEERLFGQIGNGNRYQGIFGGILNRLTLARTALALEEYRSIHGNLPEMLDQLKALTPSQRKLISWDCKKSRLRSNPSVVPQFSSVSGRRNLDLDEANDHPEYSLGDPDIWKIRPDFPVGGL